jgi:putative OmpL-like beta-barrel porin-2
MHTCRLALLTLSLVTSLHAQSTDPQQLQRRVDELQSEVRDLKSEIAEIKKLIPAANAPAPVAAADAALPVVQTITATDRSNLDFLRDTTINAELDTYYAYNFNHPYNRVNLLRAYDVLSNNISLNQADLVVEHAPDVSAGRRFGARLDLQFGQATDTLQGNPINEPRPEIYRNIFQAYGTYIAPVGSGLTLDIGKWASSLGLEGNYTKDQINYSRAYFFNFLPFYHAGVRANYKVNDKIAVNYWIVNGTNQTEATNAFKDELFGFVVTPNKSINWTINYYLGQDNPDRTLATNCGAYPLQPGLCSDPIRPAPDGRTHIFDSYVTWQTTPKLELAVEGDYFISRVWREPTDGNSSAPAHVDGGAAYARYQFTPKVAIGARGEYLSDHNGLFSSVNQALKETTLTYDYQLADGFLMRYEWRRDFSNRPYFYSDEANVFKKDQNTATVGLVWWFGRKQGAW